MRSEVTPEYLEWFNDIKAIIAKTFEVETVTDEDMPDLEYMDMYDEGQSPAEVVDFMLDFDLI